MVKISEPLSTMYGKFPSTELEYLDQGFSWIDNFWDNLPLVLPTPKKNYQRHNYEWLKIKTAIQILFQRVLQLLSRNVSPSPIL